MGLHEKSTIRQTVSVFIAADSNDQHANPLMGAKP